MFSIFFYQNETKNEEICGHDRVGALDKVKLGLLNFSIVFGRSPMNLGSQNILNPKGCGEGQCVFKWILRGHLKLTPSPTI